MSKLLTCIFLASCFASFLFLSSDVAAVDTLVDRRVVNSSLTSNASLGDPVTVTWSIVPDGTPIGSNQSDFISTLDAYHNVTNPTSDLTQRVWFAPIQNALDSFTNKTGLTYIYEPNDDGSEVATVNGRFTSSGVSTTGEPGVRGDYRLGGYDFTFAGAFTSVPTEFSFQNGFTPVDRGHSNTFFSTRDGANLSLNALDFLVTHETLHSVGSNHIRVNDTANLSAVTGSGGTREGPQFADLLSLQRRYGDFYEKNGGNDTLATATDLGAVSSVATLRIGFDAGVGSSTAALQIADSAVDFVSIDDDGDTDFFRFTSTSATDEVVVHLTPRGAQYDYTNESLFSNGAPIPFSIDASSLSDLSLSVLDGSGNLIQSVDANGIGEGETIALTPGMGDFFVQVNGDADNIQFFALEITSTPPTTALYRQDFSNSNPISDINGAIPDGTLFNVSVGEMITGGDATAKTTNGDYSITITGGGANADDGYIFNETANSGFNAFDTDYNFETGAITFTHDGVTYTGTIWLRQNVNVGQEFVNIESVALLEDDVTGEIFIEVDYNFFADVPTPNGNDQFLLTTNFGLATDVSNFDIFTADGFTGNDSRDTATHRLVLIPAEPFILGDSNGDGVVNFLDIAPFIGLLTTGTFLDQADVNRDGEVNFLDIAPFIAILSSQ